jgi:hypothetical protein
VSDTGRHTGEEIAATFGVARATLYRHLSAQKDGHDRVMVVYRNSRRKVDARGRPYGETGAGPKVQYDADRPTDVGPAGRASPIPARPAQGLLS